MDVASAHLHIPEGPNVVRDGEDQKTHSEKCDEEAHGCEQEASVRTVRYLLMDEVAELGEMQQQEQNCDDDGDKDQE
jgi:hypothetical protein